MFFKQTSRNRCYLLLSRLQKILFNKCQIFHSEIFKDHNPINMSKINEEFINKCKEDNHNNCKLEFFCKEHNILCCACCITKIKKGGYGQHFDCDVYHIKDIKDEKRNKLKENVNNLEELNKQIEKTINKLKKIFEEINKNKEELKTKYKQYLLK